MAHALMLILDDASQRGVRHIRSILAQAGVCPEPSESERPHITLALWKDVDLESVKKHLPTFASQFHQFSVRFHGATILPGTGILCLSPTPTIRLLDIHAHAHTVFDESGRDASRAYYPERWVPHVSLARDLNDERLLAGVDLVAQMKFPLKGTVEAIALVRLPDRFQITCKLAGA